MLGMHIGKVPAPNAREAAGLRRRDTYDWLQAINRASVVANVEAGLLKRDLAARIVEALDDMRDGALRPGAERPDLYITFEPELLRRAGTQASVLHVGRSSQDILATANAGLNRDRLVRVLEAIVDVRSALLETAEREGNALLPAYTNGVQAQPTLFAHTLLAYDASFARDAQRVLECLRRFDFSPMGSAVCNGTGWALPVERMAELLGFERTARNACDAGQCAGNDLPLEISQIVTSAMLHVATVLADFSRQYAAPHPWIRLGSANGVYHSSAMPQKRNPGFVNDCRRDAGLVLGEAQSVVFRMHNLPLGMADVRDAQSMDALADDACVTLRTAAEIVRSLVVDRERALSELNADWTCTQEVADRLVRSAGTDFRSAHGFASAVVTFAREHDLKPADLDYALACRLWQMWRTTLADPDVVPENLPIGEGDLLGALDPAGIVAARATPGSCNPDMVEASLKDTRRDIEKLEAYVEDYYAHSMRIRRILDDTLYAVIARTDLG